VQISAREFIDFVLASGAGKTSVVRRIAAQRARPFDPQTDYWLPLRAATQRYFRGGAADGQILERAVESAAEDRVRRYRRAADGIVHYRGRREIEWFDPPRLRWNWSGLTVTCNPDLGVVDRDTRYLLRFYYDAATAPRALVSAHAELIYVARGSATGVEAGLLDVDRARIRTAQSTARWTETLEQEAENFMNYWNRRRPPQRETA
jgi:hypothetical protein